MTSLLLKIAYGIKMLKTNLTGDTLLQGGISHALFATVLLVSSAVIYFYYLVASQEFPHMAFDRRHNDALKSLYLPHAIVFTNYTTLVVYLECLELTFKAYDR
jgi:hypothetical protein